MDLNVNFTETDIIDILIEKNNLKLKELKKALAISAMNEVRYLQLMLKAMVRNKIITIKSGINLSIAIS